MIGVYHLPQACGSLKIIVRNYYSGDLHITYEGEPGIFGVAEQVQTDGSCLRFHIAEPAPMDVTLTVADGAYTGSALVDGTAISLSGDIAEITAADDRIGKMTAKKRALIMYATITKNTEKIAACFRDAFEHYGWSVDFLRLKNGGRPPMNFDAYDIVCLGSPIIAGSPMKCVIKQFSPGGGTDLEDCVAANAEAGLGYNHGGVGLRGPEGGPGAPDAPDPSELPPMPEDDVVRYAGGPAPHGIYHPLGIVFTTYGGGYYGSNEALATVETLKLYLEQQNVKVVGRFACPGMEFGPAGVVDGAKPHIFGNGKLDPPVYYKDADGNYHAGSFFFHTHMDTRPNRRDQQKAYALAADILEDFFLSFDGIRKDSDSVYMSIT